MAFEPPPVQGRLSSASPCFGRVCASFPMEMVHHQPDWSQTGPQEEQRKAGTPREPEGLSSLHPKGIMAEHGSGGCRESRDQTQLRAEDMLPPFTSSSSWALGNIWLCDKGCFLGEPLSHSQVSHLHSLGLLETNGKYFSPDVFSNHIPGTSRKD